MLKQTRARKFSLRLLLTLLLLTLTVPWWPGLGGEVAGVPAWAAFALLASALYAGVVAWLLQRHWDDGSSDGPSAPHINSADPD